MLNHSPSPVNKLKKTLDPLNDARSRSVLKQNLSRRTIENSLKSSNLINVPSTSRLNHTQVQENLSISKNNLSASNIIASPRSKLLRKPGKPGTLLKLGHRSPAKNSLMDLDTSKGLNKTEVGSRDYSLEKSLSPLRGEKSPSLGLLPNNKKHLKPLVQAGALNLRDELEKEVDASPYCKVDKSALFYDTVKHLDACGKCFTSCQKHEKSPFSVNYKGPKESTYRRDFSPAAGHGVQTEPDATKVSRDIYESPKPKYSVPINSTSRNDFKVWDQATVKDKGPVNSLGPNNGDYFWGKSSYNASYFNYGSTKVIGDLRNYNSSAAIDLPFTGQSLYKKDFSGLDLANSPRKIERKERSPLPLGSVFLGESTSARAYKNHNVSPVPKLTKPDEEEYTGGIKAYKNQYQSLYGKDFVPKLEPKCPANQYAETHNVPRLKKPLPRHHVERK